MKIVLSLLLMLSLTSCTKFYNHKLSYSVAVTYTNGDVDTLSGEYVLPHSELDVSPLSIGLNRGLGSTPCVSIKHTILNLQTIACDVRRFNLLSQNVVTTPEK